MNNVFSAVAGLVHRLFSMGPQPRGCQWFDSDDLRIQCSALDHGIADPATLSWQLSSFDRFDDNALNGAHEAFGHGDGDLAGGHESFAMSGGGLDNDITINPATGLPMIGGIGGFDAGGKIFGTDSHDWCHSDAFHSDAHHDF